MPSLISNALAMLRPSPVAVYRRSPFATRDPDRVAAAIARRVGSRSGHDGKAAQRWLREDIATTLDGWGVFACPSDFADREQMEAFAALHAAGEDGFRGFVEMIAAIYERVYREIPPGLVGQIQGVEPVTATVADLCRDSAAAIKDIARIAAAHDPLLWGRHLLDNFEEVKRSKSRPVDPSRLVRGTPLERLLSARTPIRFGFERFANMVRVTGPVGSGKTSLLESMVISLLQESGTIVVFDSQSNLANFETNQSRRAELIPSILRDRAIDPERTYLLDIDSMPAINILEHDPRDPGERAQVLQMVQIALANADDGTGSAKQALVLQKLVELMAQNPGSTLADMHRALSSREDLPRYLARADDDLTKWFNGQFVSGGYDQTRDALEWRFNRLASVPGLDRLYSAPRSQIDFGRIFQERATVLVNLDMPRIGSDAAGMVGRIILAKMIQAIFRRGLMPADERVPMAILIDEARHLMAGGEPSILVDALTQLRKYGCGLAAFYQYVGLLSRQIEQALIGVAGLDIAAQPGDPGVMAATARAMGRSPEWLQDLGNGEMALKVARHMKQAASIRFPFAPMSRRPQRSMAERAELMRHLRGRWQEAHAVPSAAEEPRPVTATGRSLRIVRGGAA